MASAVFDKMVVHIGEFLERDASHLRPDSPLRGAAAGLDSLKTFELILYLDECFGVDLDDENLMERITTLGQLAGYIEESLSAKRGIPAPQ